MNISSYFAAFMPTIRVFVTKLIVTSLNFAMPKFLPARINDHFFNNSNERVISFIFLMIIISAIIRIVWHIFGGLFAPLLLTEWGKKIHGAIKRFLSISLYKEGEYDGRQQAEQDIKNGCVNHPQLLEKWKSPNFGKILLNLGYSIILLLCLIAVVYSF